MSDKKSTPEKARRLHQLALEMVVRQNVILKSARIYEPNNLIFNRQLALLHSLIETALAEFGEAVFTVRASTLFFNSLRLKFGFANYHFFKFVSEEYHKREIGVLRFEPGITEDDIKRLALAMVKGSDGHPAGSYRCFGGRARETGHLEDPDREVARSGARVQPGEVGGQGLLPRHDPPRGRLPRGIGRRGDQARHHAPSDAVGLQPHRGQRVVHPGHDQHQELPRIHPEPLDERLHLVHRFGPPDRPRPERAHRPGHQRLLS